MMLAVGSRDRARSSQSPVDRAASLMSRLPWLLRRF